MFCGEFVNNKKYFNLIVFPSRDFFLFIHVPTDGVVIIMCSNAVGTHACIRRVGTDLLFLILL